MYYRISFLLAIGATSLSQIVNVSAIRKCYLLAIIFVHKQREKGKLHKLL